jgi:hypothetical protein
MYEYNKIILIVNFIIILVIIYIIYNTYNNHPLHSSSSILESFTLESNAANYDTLISKLNQLNDNINSSKTDASEFVKAHPIYDPIVSMNVYNDINSYENMIKTKADDAKFFIDQIIKDKRLNLLNEELNSIANNPTLPTPSVNSNKYSIKNPFAGVNLNLEPASSSDPSLSLIYLNGKCLKYDATGKYSLNDCNLNDTAQQFKLNKINTVAAYNSAIDESQSNFRITNSQLAQIAGFYAVQPASNNKECLTLKSNDITVEPCNMTNLQRWNASNNKMSC